MGMPDKPIIGRIVAGTAMIARNRERIHARHNQKSHKKGRVIPPLKALTAYWRALVNVVHRVVDVEVPGRRNQPGIGDRSVCFCQCSFVVFYSGKA